MKGVSTLDFETNSKYIIILIKRMKALAIHTPIVIFIHFKFVE
jgi:hypothetical protein